MGIDDGKGVSLQKTKRPVEAEAESPLSATKKMKRKNKKKNDSVEGEHSVCIDPQYI